MPGVTISAGYGAGGSVIAPAVAARLGVPLLDRAISSTIAEQLNVSIEEAESGEPARSFGDRFLMALRPLAGGALGAGTDAAPPNAEPPEPDPDPFRDQAEAIMRAALPGGVVILGRAGGACFREEPDVLRVRLFGPAEARIRQAARIEQVNEPTAERRLPHIDKHRAQYVRRLYNLDINDPALYHLQLDSTALPLDACADLITTAYRALVPA
jgi:cytidylate kinase